MAQKSIGEQFPNASFFIVIVVLVNSLALCQEPGRSLYIKLSIDIKLILKGV